MDKYDAFCDGDGLVLKLQHLRRHKGCSKQCHPLLFGDFGGFLAFYFEPITLAWIFCVGLIELTPDITVSRYANGFASSWNQIRGRLHHGIMWYQSFIHMCSLHIIPSKFGCETYLPHIPLVFLTKISRLSLSTVTTRSHRSHKLGVVTSSKSTYNKLF